MGNIIQPKGRTVRRIVIEVDSKGQATLEASNLDVPNQVRPLVPMEIALILSQLLATTIVTATADQMRRNSSATKEKENNNGSI